MRVALVVIVLLIAGVALLIVGRPLSQDGVVVPAPTRTASDPMQDLGALRFTPEQLDALLVAGFEIQKGIPPSVTLDAKQLATFAAVERTLTAAVCPPSGSADTCARYRIDVPHCLERAGEIIAWRLRARAQVESKLYIAAMGVSVTGREFPTFPNLVQFCREMLRLDPATQGPPPPRSSAIL